MNAVMEALTSWKRTYVQATKDLDPLDRMPCQGYDYRDGWPELTRDPGCMWCLEQKANGGTCAGA